MQVLAITRSASSSNPIEPLPISPNASSLLQPLVDGAKLLLESVINDPLPLAIDIWLVGAGHCISPIPRYRGMGLIPLSQLAH